MFPAVSVTTSWLGKRLGGTTATALGAAATVPSTVRVPVARELPCRICKFVASVTNATFVELSIAMPVRKELGLAVRTAPVGVNALLTVTTVGAGGPGTPLATRKLPAEF